MPTFFFFLGGVKPDSRHSEERRNPGNVAIWTELRFHSGDWTAACAGVKVRSFCALVTKYGAMPRFGRYRQ